MSILVTGGAGYIGSHTVVELLNEGEKVVIVDNFVNSKPSALEAIKNITNKDFKFYELDLRDKEGLNKVFEENKDITAVVHFAGLKAVGESVAKPIEYYDNNIYGTLVLLEVMKSHNVKKIIFSSSATVYGDPKDLFEIKNAITKAIPNVEFDMDEIAMIPKEKITLSGEDLDTFKKLITMLEDIEDVQHVYHNVEL